MAVALLSLVTLSAPYQLCNFSCADEQWVACRAEKCTPRLPEDACRDGSEATLLPISSPLDSDLPATSITVNPEGLAVGSPQECAVFEASHIGSFSERCNLCMSLVGEAIDMVRLGLSESNGPAALRSGGAKPLCDQALAVVESSLPTVRTCRLQPSACTTVLAAAHEHACPATWEQLMDGVSASSVRAQQQQRCGALLTQRKGSGVDDGLVCAVPRDLGARVMAISAVVATCIIVAQLSMTWLAQV